MHPTGPTAPSALRILLLDDDVFMLDLLRAMLGELGPHRVLLETDGPRALELLREHTPDLLVCDLSMPDMDGIEFLRHAAEAGFGGAVVLVSGMEKGVRLAAERLASAQGLNLLGAFKKPLLREQLAGVLYQLQGPKMGRPPAANSALAAVLMAAPK